MKTIKFYTLGCKVNQYETQSIRERFIKIGFKELLDGQPADVYMINTCTVTHRADSDSRKFIHKAKRENPNAKVIVTGCLVERDSAHLSNLKEIDFIISKRFFAEGISDFCGHTRAFLKVQDGCNNSCSYCKVPLARGRSRSRPLDEIVNEAELLVRGGFKEIVLSGICLGAYGKDAKEKIALIDVIEALEKIDGLWRIRLSSIEAGDVSEALMHKMRQAKKVCRHLHIPIQSGDDGILEKMNRRYCRNDYLGLIRKLKNLIPEIAITTDVLVGFPGEDEANFQNTIDLLREIMPLKVHIFPYSERPGTYAAENFPQKLPPLTVKERILRLEDIAHNCALTFKKKFLNKEMDVLVEARFKKDAKFWQGYTDNYIKVLIKSEESLKNKVVPLRLKEIINNTVLGEMIN